MLRLLGIRRKVKAPTNPISIREEDENIKLMMESKHFLNVFPELVWEYIAKKLDDEDLQNLINSSPYFRHLFEEQRVHFLLKNVLQIFVPWLKGVLHYNKGRVYFDTEEKEVLALVFNCRLVCRSWNKCIRDIAQEIFRQGRESSYEIRDLRSVFGFLNKPYEFYYPEHIDNFIKNFENSTFSPFLGETISIILPPATDKPPHIRQDKIFHDKTLGFLELFGRHITHCEIRITRMYTSNYVNNGYYSSEDFFINYDSKRTYLKLMDLLWAMPNLKVLRFKSFEKIFNVRIKCTRDSPTFEKLKSIDLGEICPAIGNAIVSKNLKVNWLCVRHYSSQSGKSGYLNYFYTNLEHLHLMWYSWNEICNLEKVNSNWKLKMLTLNCCAEDENIEQCKASWLQLFNILSKKFGRTLEYLELGLPKISGGDDGNKLVLDMTKYRLDFPKLKRIHLIISNYTPFDFLLGVCNTLEYLHISFCEKERKSPKRENLVKLESKETVKFYGCFCVYCRSKLWKSFPKLRTVQITYSKTETFTRLEMRQWHNQSSLVKSFCKFFHPTKSVSPSR